MDACGGKGMQGATRAESTPLTVCLRNTDLPHISNKPLGLFNSPEIMAGVERTSEKVLAPGPARTGSR